MRTDDGEGRVDDFSELAGEELVGDLTDELRARVKSELEPGERLIWVGGSSPPPVPNLIGYTTASTIALVLLVGGTLVIIFATGKDPLLPKRDNPVPLGVILCVGGLVTTIGTIAHWIEGRNERRRQSGNSYAVTGRRAIAWMPEPKTRDAIRVISIPRGTIRNVERVVRPDGSGDLDFLCSPDFEYNWRFSGFKRIADLRRVEQIVRNNLVKDEKTA